MIIPLSSKKEHTVATFWEVLSPYSGKLLYTLSTLSRSTNMFARLFSFFSEKPAPSRNIDVSNLFPVNDAQRPSLDESENPNEAQRATTNTSRKRNRHRGSYAPSSSTSTMRFR